MLAMTFLQLVFVSLLSSYIHAGSYNTTLIFQPVRKFYLVQLSLVRSVGKNKTMKPLISANSID
jgi:hypothetical protein